MRQPPTRARCVPAAGRVAGAGLLALLAWLAIAPGVAQAHATTLLSSSPRAGQQLGTAPGVVALQFSQPLDPRLSQVTVTDPAGTRVAGTASGTEARVALATNQPGSYQVAWTAVSTDDGHTSRGGFQFSGGTATFRLPRLPAPDGAALLTLAQRRMHTLRTVALTERLSWGAGATRARYQLEAPNHLRIIAAGGTETVIIGDTRYSRDTPGTPWKVDHDFPVTPAPSYVWDYFAPLVAPQIIGSQPVDGHPTRIVAFFGRSDQVPVWFRLWVDQGGLVRRAQMLAQGHFMDHDYHGFDAPTAILPPAR